MTRYKVEIIGHHNALRMSPYNYASGIAADLAQIQDHLGDGWELVSCTDGPRPFTIVTVWKSDAPSVKIENLRTGLAWMQHFQHQILDFDGWPGNDGVGFGTTDITLDEYRRRYNMCTVNSLQGKREF